MMRRARLGDPQCLESYDEVSQALMAEMKRINQKKVTINFKIKKILALSTYSRMPLIGKKNWMFMMWAS
jgi:hypothetical protein